MDNATISELTPPYNPEQVNLRTPHICPGTFDYEKFAPADQAKLRKGADLIRNDLAAADHHAAKTVEHFISAGRMLNKIKCAFKHGQFIPWVQLEFKESYRSVVENMRIAALADKYPGYDLTGLTKHTLLLLASKKIPETARTEILEKVSSGEKVTIAETKSIIEEHKLPVTPEIEIEPEPDDIEIEELNLDLSVGTEEGETIEAEAIEDIAPDDAEAVADAPVKP